MTKEILLTGSTGFIGSSLLQKWLDCTDANLTLLVRPRREKRPQDRIQGLLSQLYPAASVPSLFKRTCSSG